MSHGFVVKSDTGKVLIHSEAENLFFVGKARLTGTTGKEEVFFDTSAKAHVGEVGANYRIGHVSVRIPKSNPNIGSLGFFPFIDTSLFSNGTVFSLESVTQSVHQQTPTHTEILVTITVLLNHSLIPTIYLFANSPEVIAVGDVEEINTYGVEVLKSSGVPYKVYDSTKTPLVITGTTTVRPSQEVPVEAGRSNLKVNTHRDIPVANLNSKRALIYCPMQADGGAYKTYSTDIIVRSCAKYHKAGPDLGGGKVRASATKKVCTADLRRRSDYEFYAYYKAVFRIQNNKVYLTYLPIMFKPTVQSQNYFKDRKLGVLERAGTSLTRSHTIGVSLKVSKTFLADTFNKTRNSDHDYLVLFADKSLYD